MIWRYLLTRKVDECLSCCKTGYQGIFDLLDLTRRLAHEVSQGNLPRKVTIAHDQLVDSLSLQTINFSTQNCSFCEFSSFCHPEAKRFHLVHNTVNDRPASMNLQFNDILSIETTLLWEEYYNCLVQ